MHEHTGEPLASWGTESRSATLVTRSTAAFVGATSKWCNVLVLKCPSGGMADALA
jgi:hypothetical protein